MWKRQVQIAIALLFGLNAPAQGSDLDHSRWDAVVKQYVTPRSRVEYQSLRQGGLTNLDAYLHEIGEPWPADMSEPAVKAALINAYNAFTVRWIVSNYPIQSIWRTNQPFKFPRHMLDGMLVSLDDIETRLRGMHDPRIHSALVCAARSCPPLRREAYIASRIGDQLDDNVRLWLADPHFNEFDQDHRIARVSSIFNWYAGDFDEVGGVRKFLARFAPAGEVPFLEGPGTRIEYQTYHWGLNDTSPLGSGYSQLAFYLDWAKNGYAIDAAEGWFLNLGQKHGVNPIVFGSIYVGAIPFFSLSVAWIIRNLRRGRSPALPVICASFCFVSAYLYLLIAGKDIPVWVYFFVAGMLGFGLYSTIRKIKARLTEGGHA